MKFNAFSLWFLVFLYIIQSISVYTQEPSEIFQRQIDTTSLPVSLKKLNLFSDPPFKDKSESQKALAIHSWVSKNIEYDYFGVENVTLGFDSDEVVKEALEKRKGICMHFAELFHALAKQSGLRSVVVFGYTKNAGRVSRRFHAWVAVEIDFDWYLFDPTWESSNNISSGNEKFVNTKYYMIKPEKMIKTHMPLDPLYQFLNYPMSHSEFADGAKSDSSYKIDYVTSINKFLSLDECSQYPIALSRVENFGITNRKVEAYYSNLYRKYKVCVANQQVDYYNQAIIKFNEVSDQLNLYINDMNSRGGRYPNSTVYIENRLNQLEENAQVVKNMLMTVNPPIGLAEKVYKSLQNLELMISMIEKEKAKLRNHQSKQQ